MSLLKNMRFSRKFAIVGATLIVVASLVVGSVFVALTNIAASSERGWQRVAAAVHVAEAGQLRDTIAVVVSAVLAKTAAPGAASEQGEARQKLTDLAQQLRTSLQQAEHALVGSDQERFAEERSKVEPILASFILTSEDLIALVAKGQREAALTEQHRLTTRFSELSTHMTHFNEVLTSEAATLQEHTRDTVVSTQRLLVGGASVGVAFILLVLILITRSITGPMATLTYAASRIANGEIDQRVDYVSGDEIGTLAAAFRNVIHYLQEMAQAADTMSKGDLTVTVVSRSERDIFAQSFRRMVDSLRSITGKVKESSQVVATSISQILTSTAQLAASVNETATSVSQTATTVEEVKQTAAIPGQHAGETSGVLTEIRERQKLVLSPLLVARLQAQPVATVRRREWRRVAVPRTSSVLQVR